MSSRRWCFTLNNYDEDAYQAVRSFLDSERCKYGVVGKETGETGTPHLQGFVILPAPQRLSFLRRFLSPRAHYEQARGSSVQAADYCKKEDTEAYEVGVLPKPGKGSQWERFRDWLRDYGSRPSAEDLVLEFPSLYGQYKRGMYDIIDVLFPPDPVDYSDVRLRLWQHQLRDILAAAPNDRTIEFYVDPRGATGKSFFTRYYISVNDDSQYLSVGKRDDLAHAIDPTKRVFIFDVPRGGMEFLQYGVLEMLKNGIIFSPKYDSKSKRLHHVPHVVVFCNEEPDRTKLTVDRYAITRLSEVTHNILN